MRTTTADVVSRRSPFFVALAWALAVTLALGFARSFFLYPVLGSKPLTVALIIHGLCGTAWFALLIQQARLARARRMPDHRQWGRWGPYVAAAVILSALWIVAISAFDGRPTGSGLPEQVGLFIQLTTTAWFAALATSGFLLTRQPDAHRRLMILATITMLAPAFSRITRLFRDGGPPLFDSATLAIPFILALAWYDWRQLGRAHRVTLWIGGAYILWTQIRMPLARSDAWASLVASALGGG